MSKMTAVTQARIDLATAQTFLELSARTGVLVQPSDAKEFAEKIEHAANVLMRTINAAVAILELGAIE